MRTSRRRASEEARARARVPSVVGRSAFLAKRERALSRSHSSALAGSPAEAARASLQSMTPAPVRARSSLIWPIMPPPPPPAAASANARELLQPPEAGVRSDTRLLLLRTAKTAAPRPLPVAAARAKAARQAKADFMRVVRLLLVVVLPEAKDWAQKQKSKKIK